MKAIAAPPKIVMRLNQGEERNDNGTRGVSDVMSAQSNAQTPKEMSKSATPEPLGNIIGIPHPRAAPPATLAIFCLMSMPPFYTASA